MPTAPSFQSFEMITEPFVSNGKQYVKVKNPKTGNTRTVRWYEDAEYNKLYPEAKAISHANDPYWKSQKDFFGFGEEGYITIFRGETYEHKEYLKALGAKYTRWWGWGLPSEVEVPEDLQFLNPVKLYWEPMARNNETLLGDSAIKEYVDTVIYEPDESEFVGSIGERLEFDIVVEKNIKLDGQYGTSYMHIMKDQNGNNLVWTTASKSWATGSKKKIRGTVKDHRMYHNSCQTVLSRCTEVNK